MYEKLRRQLMAAADASPGGGSTASTTTSQSDTQAQGAKPMEVLLQEAEQRGRNAAFAEQRRAKEAKKAAKAASKDSSATTQQQQANDKPKGDKSAKEIKREMRNEFRVISDYHRELDQLGVRARVSSEMIDLGARQARRENPSDMKAFVSKLFGVSAAASTTSNQAAQRASNDRPASDAGAPHQVSSGAAHEDMFRMTEDQLKALLQRVGPRKYNEMLRQQMQGKRFKLDAR